MNTLPHSQLPLKHTPVIPEAEPLRLSASALQTYAACPRQFYYQHLLKLPSPTFDSAAWGKLWHSILEVFHQQPEPNPLLLRQLVAQTAGTQPRPEGLWPSGALTWIDTLPALHHRDVVQKMDRVLDSMLQDDAFLLTASTQQGDKVEHTLHLTFPGVNTTFRLRLDLAYQPVAGQWHIVDYKTYGSSKFNAVRAETLIDHLHHGLTHLPARDTEAPHREQYPYPTAKPYIHQMPLYWLAAQQAGLTVDGFSLHILRPVEQGGCVRVTADTTVVDTWLPAFAEALTQWIDNDIRQATAFLPEPAGKPCDLCAYTSVCPQAADDPSRRVV